MGSGQSTRKLTIANEEEVDVIKVSNAVVQRLAQRSRETTEETVREAQPSPVQHPTTPVPHTPLSQDGNVLPSYPGHYHPEFTLSALEIQQQKERELMKQEVYWQKRMQNLEKHYKKINYVMEEEYKKIIQEINAMETGQKHVENKDGMQPCVERIDNVLKCYQDHVKETLKCNGVVRDFVDCVDQHRARVVTAHC
ncbi:hypothetical protein KM043_002219 [Ampulex compressa]|nr:hypothetical protein KM043_002219 [Ampulex compressa]